MITYHMNWTIEFFDEKVESETLALPPKILAKMLHIFELIEMAGARLESRTQSHSIMACLKYEPKPKRVLAEVSIVIKKEKRLLSCTLL